MKLTITLLSPMHVLELSDKLRLSLQQLVATRELMNIHKIEVRALCEQFDGAERDLDSAFKDKRVTDSDVGGLAARIGILQAGIRSAHLKTHLAQSALLTPEQIAEYFTLRG